MFHDISAKPAVRRALRAPDTTRVAAPHELPEHTAEAVSRFLTRLVPLIYGALLGATGGNLALGLLAGIVASTAFDLSMADHSLARPVARRLTQAFCNAVAAVQRRLRIAINRRGLNVPALLNKTVCSTYFE